MKNKSRKEHIVSSLETSAYGDRILKWINRVIGTLGLLEQKRGIDEMNIYQMIVLISGVVALLLLEYSYGIQLRYVFGVIGISLLLFFAFMNKGRNE